jgi:probable F420-dependent oxidoreductase
MTGGVKVGVALPNYRGLASTESLIAVAQRSEALGFDSVWLTDHVVIPREHVAMFGATVFEPVVCMAFVAAHTSRVQIGSAVLVLPYRNPVVLAKQLSTIDALSGGRVILGVGAGWMESEFAALGVPYADRGARTDEYLRVIRELWTGDEPHFEGRFVTFGNLSAEPRPVRRPRPPILVGGSGRRAIRRAVTLGDGWLPDGLGFAELERGIQLMRQLADEVDRDQNTLSVCLRTGLWLAEVGGGGGLGKLAAPWNQASDGAAATERAPFQGSIAQVIEDVGTAGRLGVDELILESAVQRTDERFDMIEAFASDVLPSVRKAFAS